MWAGHAEVALSLAGDPLALRAASRLNNLGLVHKETGAYSEAKELHERALAIVEKALGPDHPSVTGYLPQQPRQRSPGQRRIRGGEGAARANAGHTRKGAGP